MGEDIWTTADISEKASTRAKRHWELRARIGEEDKGSEGCE